MKKKNLTLAVILIGLLLALGACNTAAEGEQQQVVVEPTAIPSIPVEVAQVEQGNIDLVFAYSGNLQSVEDVNIFPGAAGKIETILVAEGDVVKAGDPLAIIESDAYEIQLQQAQAALKNTQLQLAKMTLGSRPAEIATAQAAVELAKASLADISTINDDERTAAAANVARAQSALKRAQTDYDKIAWAGDIGQSREAQALEEATIGYENALAGYNLGTTPTDAQLAPLMVQVAQAELNLAIILQPFRQTDFEIAKNGIRQAELSIDAVQLQIDETIIEAPFDGIIVDLHIALGSNVSPQTPIARFVTQEVEVKINVEETNIGLIEPRQFAAIQVPALPGKDFPAIVTRISPLANKDSRAFAVTITPQDETGVLRSGMFASVSLLANELEDTTLTPLTSITLDNNNEEIVFVVDSDNKVEERKVVTGISDNEQVQIIEGLQPGDVVVIAGQRNLSNEALVEVVNGG
ncbi:efflux RND transporter periplasmic adaptor subunit [Anaerolineales bacterium HSG6]|nr:efflux RND transporter periplasmic adaptor subunit [Anaerolineales bacterium HSG6]MDM8532829.1 efflux RND transporter periplasmic adaptor subunit [Anaerolineales bacterium HSG25]